MVDIVSCIYPNLLDNVSNIHYFEDKAILALTVEVAEKINEYVINLILDEEKHYFSFDSICKSDIDASIDLEWFTVEFLNQIKCSGLPNHELKLKKGVLVILLWNIDQTVGLYNGTWLIILELGVNVISAEIVYGNNIGEKVYIAQMNLTRSNPGTPFKF